MNRAKGFDIRIDETVSQANQKLLLHFDAAGSRPNHELADTVTASNGLRRHSIVLGRTLYARVPTSNVASNAHKRWVAVTVPETSAEKRLVGSNGVGYLRLLAGVTGKVSRVGTTTIAGVPTTEFAVDVNLDSTPFRSVGGSVPQYIQLMRSAGISDLPMHIWLDSIGQPRQLTMALTVQGAKIDLIGHVTLTNHLLHLRRPPARDTHVVPNVQQWALVQRPGAIGVVG